MTQGGSPIEAEEALVRFLVTVAYLNTTQPPPEKNYTMLVHTSGSRDAHEADRVQIEKTVKVLLDPDSVGFEDLAAKIFAAAIELYPKANHQALTEYVVENASTARWIVLNSMRDRKAAGDNPTVPTSPFTIIIGGNIVSRGVTFPNLLSMFFTRNVKSKLQQDTYIQRARMFGSRSDLEHFELTIPSQLFADWQKCFVYHRLSLASIESQLGVPVWIGDSRVAVASNSSIDKKSVTLDKGEISYSQFKFKASLDQLVEANPTAITTLKEMRGIVGEQGLPSYLIEFIESSLTTMPGTFVAHASSSVEGYKAGGVDKEAITRKRGFLGSNQLELSKYPNAVHHVKILRNGKGNARVFYKCTVGGTQFMQNKKETGEK